MLRFALPLATAAALLVGAALLALWLDRRRAAAGVTAAQTPIPPALPAVELEPARTTLVFSPGRSGALDRTAFEKTIDFVPTSEVLERPAKPT